MEAIPNNVISFKDKFDKTDRLIGLKTVEHWSRFNKCKHIQVLVDEQLGHVECEKCGEKLNPIWVLTRLAREETRWAYERKQLEETTEKYNAKSRCKCEHCGKMTKVPSCR